MSDLHHTHDPRLHRLSTRPGADTFVRDTQRKMDNHDLEPLLERLATMFMALDQAFRITYLSYLSDPLLAQARAMLLGKTLWEVFPKAVDSPFFHKYRAAFESSLPVHCEEYYPPLHKWFEVHISPSPDGWEVYIQEITERKQMEERIWRIGQQFQAIIDGSPACI